MKYWQIKQALSRGRELQCRIRILKRSYRVPVLDARILPGGNTQILVMHEASENIRQWFNVRFSSVAIPRQSKPSALSPEAREARRRFRLDWRLFHGRSGRNG